MARQTGMVKITCSVDDLCFYKMEGKYYVRMKSSLTGKKVKKDPAFAVTMVYAGLLGKASKIASRVYAGIEKEKRIKGLYRKITGEAMRLLKSGISIEIVYAQLLVLYMPQPEPKKYEDKNIKRAARISYGEFVLNEIFGNELLSVANPMKALPLGYNSG